MNGIPLYQVIINDLTAAMENGDYRPGDRLPSQQQLMQKYHVSRITVIRALTELERNERIIIKKGSGNYVSELFPQNRQHLPQERASEKRPVGVIISFLNAEDLQSSHLKYLQGINEYLSQTKHKTIFYGGTAKFTENQQIMRAINDGCDGIIYYPCYYTESYPMLFKLSGKKYPIVLLDQKYAEINITSVLTDNYKASYDAAAFLLNKGYKRIGYLTNTGLYTCESIKERYHGYCQALSDAGIEQDERLTQIAYQTTISSKDSAISKEEYFKKVVEAINGLVEIKCDAVMTHSDYLARDIVQICSEKGMAVPDEMAVVGFDDLSFCTYTTPTITTVRQDFYKIGYTAAQNLCMMLEDPGKKREKILIDAELIPREST